MDTINSVTSDIYDNAFSPKFADGMKAMTWRDRIIILIFCAIILYLLARLFPDRCRLACSTVCPDEENQ